MLPIKRKPLSLREDEIALIEPGAGEVPPESDVVDEASPATDEYDSPRTLAQSGKTATFQSQMMINETFKPVYHGKRSRMFSAWLVHVPALLTTAVLIAISNLQLYWYPEKGPGGRVHPDIINNLLQMASKVHEIMIIASLAALGLAMFRRRLVRQGVRLGILTGGYRIGDIGYLATKAFWHQGGWRSLSTWEIFLAGFVAFSTIMSQAVGPASAILLVPTLGWYNLNGAFQNVAMPLSYDIEPEWVWPQDLSDQLFTDFTKCNQADGVFTEECPAGGFANMRSWANGLRYTGLKNSLVVQHPAIDLRRAVQFTEYNITDDGSDSITLTTSPASVGMISLGLFANYIKEHDIGAVYKTARYELTTNTEMFQPLVQSKCAVYDHDDLVKKKGKAYYPVDSLNCFGDADCLAVQREKPAWGEKHWNPKDFDPTEWSYSKSTNAYETDAGNSIVFFGGLAPYVKDGNKQKTWVYTCNLLARWVPSTLTIDPSVNDMVKSNVSDSKKMQKLFKSDGEDMPGSVLHIWDTWLDYLDPKYYMSSAKETDDNSSDDASTQSTTVFGEIFWEFMYSYTDHDTSTTYSYLNVGSGGEDDKEVASFLARVYGVFLTDGLSRTASQYEVRLILEDSETMYKYLDLEAQVGERAGVHRYESKGNDELATSYYTADEKGTLTERIMRDIRHDRDTKLPIDFKVRRYGYGSGQSSKTAHFAIVMMGIYLLTVALYALTIFSSYLLHMLGAKAGPYRFQLVSVAAWSDLQDLIVLALWSNPPKDADLMTDGVRSPDSIWTKTVRVHMEDDTTCNLVVVKKGDVAEMKDNIKSRDGQMA